MEAGSETRVGQVQLRLFGCWVADGEGGLDYVHEDDYTEEMWNELKRSSQHRMQNANTPKL